MKRNIARMLFLALLALAQTGCNASFGRFFHTDNPLAPVPGSALTISETGLTSVTLSYTEATDPIEAADTLQYLIIYSTTDNVGAITDPEALPSGVLSSGTWSAYASPVTVSGLANATAYYFNIIVRNTAGHFALYGTAAASTRSAPAITSGALSFSNVSYTSLRVSFAQATDTADTADKLNYLVIYSTTAGDVSSITDFTSLPSGVLSSGGWIQYPSSGTTISDLIPGTTYYFNVIVRNSANLFTLYSSGSQSTTAATPPTLPSKTLAVSGITATSAALSFTASSDSGVTYLIVYSQTGNLGTITDASALPSGSASFGTWQNYPSPVSITGLLAGTKYYVNVIAKNSSGGLSLYTMTSFDTSSTALPTISNSALTTSSVGTSTITFSFSEATNNAGAASDLDYLVVYAASDVFASITATDTASLTALGITESGTWQKYPSSAAISGLTSGTTYFFNVIVQNANGFVLYTTASAKPDDLVAPVPSPNSTITATMVSDTEISVSYNEAADNVSAASALEYKVVCSSLGAINQIATADAIIVEPGLVQNWGSYVETIQATGLSANTTYYFNVLVRDMHSPTKNIAIYTCASATTGKIAGDPFAPTVSDPALTLTQGSDIYTVSLAWTKAVDEIQSGTIYTLPANLQYKVVASSSEITEATFAAATALTDPTGDGWVVDQDSLTDITVADGITTYFMVAVKDDAGNIAYYVAADYTPSATMPSLLCYYPLNNSTTDASAKTSQTVNGTMVYAADAALGSSSCDFTGNNTSIKKSIDISSSTLNSLNDNFSISLWVKMSPYSSGSANSWEQILGRGPYGYRIQRYESTDYIMFYTVHHTTISGNESRVISKDKIADGKWHHIVCTFSSSGSNENRLIFMYVDGNSQAGTFGGTTGDWYTAGKTIQIDSYHTSLGRNMDTGTSFTNQEYTGLLDEVRIYSKVLSADEIKALGR